MNCEKLEIMHKTAQQIKHFRTAKGLSQEALALSAGLNPAFLGHIERSLKCPTIDTLNRISKALDISLLELFDFNESKSESCANNSLAIEKVILSMRTLSQTEVEQIAQIVAEIIHFKQK